MTKNAAIRLDAMLMHVRASMDMIAWYMKNNLSPEEYERYIYSIGTSAAELIDISNALYKEFPDIIPEELKPEEQE